MDVPGRGKADRTDHRSRKLWTRKGVAGIHATSAGASAVTSRYPIGWEAIRADKFTTGC